MVDVTKKDSLLDMQAAAEHCDVHWKTIYRWCRQGLESAVIGGKRYTTKEAIQHYSRQGVAPRPTRQLTAAQFSERDELVRQEIKRRFGVSY